MKYEMVFGDERLFDGASEFVEVVRFNDYSREYLWGDLNTIQLLTFRELKAIPIVAMRRIIAEPKRWTVEDKKAGRLPEVGAIVVSDGFNEKCEFLGVGMVNGFFVVRLPNGLISINSASSFSPIETPEEKVQREEDEFIDSLISVDIPVGGFFSQGARAAYRKLKGGE